MRYVLLFLFFSLLGAAIIFSFSGSEPVDNEEKEIIEREIETVKIKKEASKEQDLEKKAISNFKEIKYLEEETDINPKEQKQQEIKAPVNLKTAKVVTNTPKSQIKKNVIKYKPVENPRLLVDSPIGDFFIQDHLQAITPTSYNKSMGKIVAEGNGYYFIESDKPANQFPVVVKRSGRTSLALLTGLISIKTKDTSLPARLKDTYNLTEVQAFSHIDLYIYKTNQVENLVSIYNSIKGEVGVDSAELEILDKRVRKL